MRQTVPEVFFVAETQFLPAALKRYLTSIGADTYRLDSEASGAELLIEVAGRLCYRSWKPGLNANVKKVREGNHTYLGNVVKQKHGSVFEHCSVSFIFHNVSRVFTHELVRHRAGVGISQESLRYVRLTDIGFRTPPCFELDLDEDRRARFKEREAELLEWVESFQRWIAEAYALDSADDFEFKKQVTSAMRRYALLGLSTGILWTANMRALRHILELRTALGAEEEIRLVFDKVGYLLSTRYPAIFQDFRRTSDGEWKPEHSKI